MRLLVVGALGVALAGCPVARVERPYAAPSAAEIVAALKARVAHAGALRIEAKVDYLEDKGERVKLTMTFLVAAPDRLRIDAESPIGGATIASLASDGRDFALLDVEHGRFLVGPSAPCNIARLIKVALAPADVVAVFAGGAPLLGDPVAVAWSGDDGGRELLTLRAAGGDLETIRLTPRGASGGGWDVVSVRVAGADGRVRWSLDNDLFSDGDPRLPSRIHIEEPARGVDVRLRVKDVERDVKPPDNVFVLVPPAGIPAEPVRCD